MPVIFANPLGFWTLLGIPLVLLIHFLQRQSISLPVSTLFMLDAIDRQSLKGRKFDRLRNSLPLWLQLLSILILTWLLIEPRWMSSNTIQRIVVVLDSSASMEPFKENAANLLGIELPKLSPSAGQTSYTLLESRSQGDRLYRGDSLDGVSEALGAWEPASGAHSPESALRVGRSLAGSEGTLIFLTDHIKNTLPYGAILFSIGTPIDNVGFAGLSTTSSADGRTWQVTVRNYSRAIQEREWFLAAGQQRTESRALTLEPGETRTLSGKFPEGTDHVRLILNSDAFTRDDQLHLILPQPKPILVSASIAPNANELVLDIINSLENAPLAQAQSDPKLAESPDLVFSTYNPLQPGPLPPVSIAFINQLHVPKEFFKGPIFSANHPLIENLNWQGLIAKSTPSIPVNQDDSPLLWQGDRALIFLREFGEIRQLIFNFDVIQSNAARLPAFVVLIDRYVNQLRAEKVAAKSENFELDQLIPISVETGQTAPDISLNSSSGLQTIPWNHAGLLRSPRDPGFFQVRQGDQLLLDASANFADTREADFSDAASRSDLVSLARKIAEQKSVEDPFSQGWLLGLIMLALFCWFLLSRAQTDSAPITATK
tara:strand:+ start:281 stop:2083 length:1803 start_codon:yes stop_codon:yes gene_type:complete